MNTRAKVFVTVALSIASTFAVPAELENATLEVALQGAWCNSDDGGKTCWGYDNIVSGSVTSCGTFPQTRTNFTGQSRYTIRGAKVCHVVTESSVPEILKPGDRFCVEILQIDSRTQRFRDLDTGDETVVYRVDTKSVQCPGLV